LNLFVWAQASSTAIPFGTLVGIVALWLLIQVPLVYIGSWYGFMRAKPWEHPTKTSSIPRQIPPQPWYLHSVQGTILTGLAPFAVLFIELLFVFKNLWQDKSGYYYVFGFLSAVTSILMVTVSEVTIIATYSQLCSEVSARSIKPEKGIKLSCRNTELPLVVAEFPDGRKQRILGVCVLRLVLLLPPAYHGLRIKPALFQLQFACLRCIRSVDGNCWIPDGIRVYPSYL
jgi:hypothetical protein